MPVLTVEQNDSVTLSKLEATRGNGNKGPKTGNDHALPI